MSLPFQRIETTTFGGVNFSDQSPLLIQRAFEPVDGGFVQRAPLESPNLINVDFLERAIGKRKGSALLESLASVMVASEIIIAIKSWVTPGTTTEVQVAVGKLSIYTNQSGTWAQINNSGGSAYTHAANVTKCSFAEVVGHLLMGIDGANKIQVYRSGANLDASLDNGNTWNDTFGGGTSTITGTWGTAYYILFEMHERLVFGTGNAVAEYTDVQQPWDRANGGFRLLKGNVVGAMVFVPEGGSELNTVAFFSTTAGPIFLSGFDLTDSTKPVHGANVALNHQCLVATDKWIMYMTREGGIEAINVYDKKDLGRRLFTGDGVSGPTDTFQATNAQHPTLPFGYYNQKKKQAMWFYPNAAGTTNSHAVVVDMFLAEGATGEQQDLAESNTRLLYWSIVTPATNPWFVSIYTKKGAVIGVLATGICYTLESGLSDLDTLPIQEFYEWGDFNGGVVGRIINWRRLAGEFKEKGSWNLLVRKYLDRSTGQFGDDVSWLMASTDSSVYDTGVYDTALYSGGAVRRATWLEVYSREVRLRFQNQETARDWILTGLSLEYQIGSRQD